jgi:hypothetical protein
MTWIACMLLEREIDLMTLSGVYLYRLLVRYKLNHIPSYNMIRNLVPCSKHLSCKLTSKKHNS